MRGSWVVMKEVVRIQKGKVKWDKFLQWAVYFYALLCFGVLKVVPFANDDVFICVSVIALTYFIGKDFFKAVNVFAGVSKRHKVWNFFYCLYAVLLFPFRSEQTTGFIMNTGGFGNQHCGEGYVFFL